MQTKLSLRLASTTLLMEQFSVEQSNQTQRIGKASLTKVERAEPTLTRTFGRNQGQAFFAQ